MSVRGNFSRRASVPARRGFTLIEMVVVCALFIAILGILGGIFTQFTQNHRRQMRRLEVQQEVMNFLETMDREVRTGFGTTFADAVSGTVLYLKNQNTDCVKYGLGSGANAGRILRAQGGAGCTEASVELASGERVTSRRTDVRRLSFAYVKKPAVDDNGTPVTTDDLLTGEQGRVTVSMRVCPKDAPNTECLDIETTITSRQMTAPPP